MGTKRSRFEYARSFVCILFLLGSVFALNARTIQGTVVDALGDPVISATVLIKGTTIGTVTDFDGNYSIDAPDDATTIVFSYVGMQTQELPISGNVINVTLKEDSEVLEEVVVTGYGTTKKRDLVTSVASVSSEQLKDMPVSTAAEAMQGKMAGVQVTTTEGAPDADVKIRVRGGTSLTQSNDPLYIVDGFPVASISDIAPSDIASMDVLKDAAATAIYGAQGANGVIIITTKDSDSDDDKMTFHFDYSGYIGWKRMAKSYDMMDARDFVLSQYEYAYLAKGETNLKSNFNLYFDKNAERNPNGQISSDATLTPISNLLDYWSEQPVYDWQRRTFGPTWGQKLKNGDDVGYAQHQGFTSNHSFSVSGGNKNASFTLSYNRIDEKGIMYGSDYSRNNIAFKSKFKPFKDFTVGMTARFSNTNVLGAGANTSEDSGSKTESRVRNAIAYTPIDLVAKDNSVLEDYDSFGSLYDPITTINHNYKAKKDNKWTLNGYASYKFLKKFTIKTELGYEGRYRDTDRYYGPTSYYSRDGAGKDNSNNVSGLGHVIVQDQRDTKLRNTNTFEYKDKKGSHNWSVLVGEEQVWKKGSSDYLYGYGYDPHTYTGENVFNFLGAALKTTYKNTINDADNMLSFFARANYDYAGRYYLTATFRADASTRFALGNQWGYFPSVAAAWRMSDEEWMSGANDWLSNLKLRFSYGTAGNNNVETGYLATTYNITPTGATYMDNATFPSSVLYVGGTDKIAPNNNLKWETTVTRDLGIDFGFFNERLTGVIDLYWNTTKDLIILYNTGGLGGYNYQYRNIGSTRNRGIELTLRGVALDKKSKELSYGLTLDANISFNENIVTSLGGMNNYQVGTSCFSGNYENTDYEFMLEEGKSVGRVYGFVSDGWYTANDFASYNQTNDTWYDANGNVIATPLEGGNAARPGTMKLKDLNGDGVINGDDRTVIGNTLPLFTGGFNITGYVGSDKWGKVDLTANFAFSYGNDIVNMSALDYSTITDKSKLRNLTANVAYGSRYSMFMENGTYVPATAVAEGGIVAGDNYAALAGTLNSMNSNAKVANPVSSRIALTDNVIEDGSFLRLSNLTIGYSLSPKWIEKAKMTNLRIFFQASNLFCITKYSGADPEVDTRSKINPLAIGVDFSAYPKARGFNVGLNLSF